MKRDIYIYYIYSRERERERERESAQTRNPQRFTLNLFLILIFLAVFSGLLSETSFSGGLRFFFVSVSACVLINRHKDLIRFSTSLFTQFPKSTVRLEKQPFQASVCYGSWNTSINSTLTEPFLCQNDSIRKLLKRSARGQIWTMISVVFSLTCHTNYQLTFEFIYFELYTSFTKLKGRSIHYVTSLHHALLTVI